MNYKDKNTIVEEIKRICCSRIRPEGLKKILEDHLKWVEGTGGQKGDLWEVDLQYTDLQGTKLLKADADKFSQVGVDLSQTVIL